VHLSGTNEFEYTENETAFGTAITLTYDPSLHSFTLSIPRYCAKAIVLGPLMLLNSADLMLGFRNEKLRSNIKFNEVQSDRNILAGGQEY